MASHILKNKWGHSFSEVQIGRENNTSKSITVDEYEATNKQQNVSSGEHDVEEKIEGFQIDTKNFTRVGKN